MALQRSLAQMTVEHHATLSDLACRCPADHVAGGTTSSEASDQLLCDLLIEDPLPLKPPCLTQTTPNHSPMDQTQHTYEEANRVTQSSHCL